MEVEIGGRAGTSRSQRGKEGSLTREFGENVASQHLGFDFWPSELRQQFLLFSSHKYTVCGTWFGSLRRLTPAVWSGPHS